MLALTPILFHAFISYLHPTMQHNVQLRGKSAATRPSELRLESTAAKHCLRPTWDCWKQPKRALCLGKLSALQLTSHMEAQTITFLRNCCKLKIDFMHLSDIWARTWGGE